MRSNRDNTGSTSNSQNDLLYSVARDTTAQLPATCLGLAGEIHADMAAAEPEAGRWLQGAVFRQMATAFVSPATTNLKTGDRIWLDFNVNRSRSDGDNNASAYSASRYQFVIGANVLQTQNASIGLGVSYASTQVSPKNGSGTLEETAPFLYGQYAPGKNKKIILDTLFSYGFNSWKTDRADPVSNNISLNSKGGGNTTLWSVGVRSPWGLKDFTIEPLVRVLWQNAYRGAMNEGITSPAALNLPNYDKNGTRLMAGFAITSKQQNPLAELFTYRISLAFGNDFGNLLHPTVQASLANEPIAINSPHVGREFGQLNMSGTYRVIGNAYAYVGLNGEARDKQLNGGINAGFNLKF